MMQRVLSLAVLILVAGCGDDDDVNYDCGNGSCPCLPGDECQIACAAPPCHIDCEYGSTCIAQCANGTCRCRQDSTCAFGCLSPPCHVSCELGSHCSGECANGTCSCGSNSSCHFECLDGNCSASCGAGSSCTLECLSGRAGERGCDFDACAAGATEVCAGGTVITCGAPCP
jgi:hypothetical protein